MKKSITVTILIIIISVTIVWFLIKRQAPPQSISSSEKFGSIHSVISNRPINVAKAIIINRQLSSTISHKGKIILNVTDAQNIKQWEKAIPNLHNDPTNKKNWVMWQNFTNAGLPFSVGETNKAWVEFDSNFININTRENSDNIRRIEMQSVWMNISNIHSSGDALLRIMGKDDTSFNAWCDKVGNRWMDEPEFTSDVSHLPNNKVYGFQVRSTFNNDKPWYILLIIADK